MNDRVRSKRFESVIWVFIFESVTPIDNDGHARCLSYKNLIIRKNITSVKRHIRFVENLITTHKNFVVRDFSSEITFWDPGWRRHLRVTQTTTEYTIINYTYSTRSSDYIIMLKIMNFAKITDEWARNAINPDRQGAYKLRGIWISDRP